VCNLIVRSPLARFDRIGACCEIEAWAWGFCSPGTKRTTTDSGLSSYLEIIDAQIQMYPAESAVVTYDLGRKLALVDLYRALGGGWNLNDSQWTSSGAAVAPAHAPTP